MRNEDENRGWKRTAGICVALVLLTGVVYWPVWTFDFVNFDDPDYASKNPHIHAGLTLETVRWAFTCIHSTNWHPLTTLSHALDWQVFGASAGGPHLVNLGLHVLNAILLFVLLRRLTGTEWRSAFVAGLFGLHPLHVESVAWISERKDVLSALFFMLTLLAWSKYAKPETEIRGPKSERSKKSEVRSPKSEIKECFNGKTYLQERPEETDKRGCRDRAMGWYTLALGLFVLGLMSKPMLVTLPFVLLLLDFWPFQRIQLTPGWGFRVQGSKCSRLLVEKLPFFALSIASCVVTFQVQRGSGTVMSIEHNSIDMRLANAAVSYVRYLGKLFWPENMAVFYPYSEWHAWSWQVLGAAVGLLVLTVVAVLMAWQKPYVAMGWFWFVGMLVPVIGLVQVGDQALADRYTYLPAIGIFVVVAWSAGEIMRRLNLARWPIAVAALFVLGACATLTARQLPNWRNTEALFTHAIAVTERNHTAYANLGIYYVEQGRYDEAIASYRLALQSKTNFPHAWNNLGLALVHEKKFAEGVSAFETALRLYPDLPETECNLGNAFVALGKLDEAIQHYAEAARLKPDYALAQANLGGMLLRNGQAAEALASLTRAVALEPGNANARCELGRALFQLEKLEDAAQQFQQALQLRPDLAAARFGWGDVLAQQGRRDEAIAQLETGLQTAPGNAVARYHLAVLLGSQGKAKAAIAQYHELLRRVPDFAEGLNNLAWLLSTNPDADVRNGAQAVEFAERACQLTGHKEALFIGTLAAAYAEAGRFEDAVASAERAKVLAEEAKQPELAARNAQLLDLYKAGKACRE